MSLLTLLSSDQWQRLKTFLAGHDRSRFDPDHPRTRKQLPNIARGNHPDAPTNVEVSPAIAAEAAKLCGR